MAAARISAARARNTWPPHTMEFNACTLLREARQKLPPARSEGNLSHDEDEKEIHALFEAGDRALMAADIDGLARIFAEDYVQYDPAGRAFTKQEVLDNLRTGSVRYPSIQSTRRRVRLFDEMA